MPTKANAPAPALPSADANEIQPADDDDSDEDDDAWGADERPRRTQRSHLAEFFDTDGDHEVDRMDMSRAGLCAAS